MADATKSWGYVVVPAGGLTVGGVTFPAGPRRAGKGEHGGWFRLLVGAGAEPISQAQFEQWEAERARTSRPSKPRPAQEGKANADSDAGDDAANHRPAQPRKPKRGPSSGDGRGQG